MSINNWNSSRKDRIREAVILNQIHKDFSSNKLQLDSILEFHTQKVSKTQTLVEQMLRSKDTSLINLMMSYGDDIVSFKTFNPSNGSIDAIINSSSFDLISNDSLRGLLVAWKDVYSDYSEEEHYALQFQMNHLFPFFRKQFDYLNPHSERNLDLIQSVEFQNIWLDNIRHSQNVLDAVKSEGVEEFVNDIIRLTSKY